MQPHFESSGSFGCSAESLAAGACDLACGAAAQSLRRGDTAPPVAPSQRQLLRQAHNRRFSSSQAHLQSLNLSATSATNSSCVTLGRARHKSATTPSRHSTVSSSLSSIGPHTQAAAGCVLLPSTGSHHHHCHQQQLPIGGQRNGHNSQQQHNHQCNTSNRNNNNNNNDNSNSNNNLQHPTMTNTLTISGNNNPSINFEATGATVAAAAAASHSNTTKPMTSSSTTEQDINQQQQLAVGGRRRRAPLDFAPTAAAPHLPPPYEAQPIRQQPLGALGGCELATGVSATQQAAGPEVQTSSTAPGSQQPPSTSSGGGGLVGGGVGLPLGAAPPPPSASSAATAAAANLAQQQQHQHRPYLLAAAAAAALAATQNGGAPFGFQTSESAGRKSKSCLACADISIKWYIVVIALLGLICALIGTIVGAVHSVGRDYFSLALLLLGVGLVLVAISWVALRITINTYKSSVSRSASQQAASGPAAAAFAASLQATGRQPEAMRHHQQQMAQNALYVMAAAAASAQLRQEAAASSAHMPAAYSRQEASCSPATSERGGRLLNGFKRQVPRSLARLISARSGGARSNSSESPGNSQQQLAGAVVSQQRQMASLRRAVESGALSPSSPTWTLGRQQQQALTTHELGRAPSPQSGDLANSGGQQQQQQRHQQVASTMAALVSVLQSQQQPLFPGTAIPTGHPFASFAQLLAAGHLAPHLHDPSFRPPPPSYNATMQEQRARMLMQERAALHQLQHQHLAPRPVVAPTIQQTSDMGQVATVRPSSQELNVQRNEVLPPIAAGPLETDRSEARHKSEAELAAACGNGNENGAPSSEANVDTTSVQSRSESSPAQLVSEIAQPDQRGHRRAPRAQVSIIGYL